MSVSTGQGLGAGPGLGGTPGPGDAGKKRDTTAATTELVLRGAVAKKSLSDVINVVGLLCPDTAHMGELVEWERVYTAAPDVRGTARAPIRLRRSILPPGAAARGLASRPWMQYSLLYYGLPDRRAPVPVEKRPLQVVPVGADGPAVLLSLGCALVHEYVRRGWRFRTRSGLLVEAYYVETLAIPGDPDSATNSALNGPDDMFAVVEVSSDRASNSEDLFTFMSYLTPSGVVLKK
jgi:hypothetical protein